MGEFFHERFKRHAVLQGHAGQRANTVHETANGRSFLGHRDEQFAGLAVLEQTDGQITFVAGDVEFVRDGRPGLGQTAAQGLDRVGSQSRYFHFQFLYAGWQWLDFAAGVGPVAAFAGLPGVEGLRAFRAITINRHAFDTHFPRVNISVADVFDGRLVGQVDSL